MGGSELQSKESAGFGGNPTPYQQPHMVSATDNQVGVMAVAKQAEGEEIAGSRETQGKNFGEGNQENQRGKSSLGINLRQLEAQRIKKKPAVTIWAKKAGHGPNKQPSEGPDESPQASFVNPAEIEVAQPFRQDMEPENNTSETGREQPNQVCNQTTLEVWNRMSRVGEMETHPAANTSVLLGKRKAEFGGSNCDDQRHLKIRKWEDYLEEETETDFEEFETGIEKENELAEAAMQPRPQP